MRISDWSSDVCSSDLEGAGRKARRQGRGFGEREDRSRRRGAGRGVEAQAGGYAGDSGDRRGGVGEDRGGGGLIRPAGRGGLWGKRSEERRVGEEWAGSGGRGGRRAIQI